MPEGDTIYRAARTLHRALAGRTVTGFESVFPRLTRIDEDRTLRGRTIEQVEARGKHLLITFSGDLVLRNCIFRELSESHRELVCGMNAALVRGLLDGADLQSMRVEGRPAEERVADASCCVRIVGR